MEAFDILGANRCDLTQVNTELWWTSQGAGKVRVMLFGPLY